jgi:hypothetical protein
MDELVLGRSDGTAAGDKAPGCEDGGVNHGDPSALVSYSPL